MKKQKKFGRFLKPNQEEEKALNEAFRKNWADRHGSDDMKNEDETKIEIKNNQDSGNGERRKITWKPLVFHGQDTLQPEDRATEDNNNIKKGSEQRQDDPAELKKKRLEITKEKVIQAAIRRINKHAKWGGSVTIYQFLRDTLLQWHSNVHKEPHTDLC